MAKVFRYTGNPDGYMDFDFTGKLICCQETIDELTAQVILNAIKNVEDDGFSISEDAIGDGFDIGATTIALKVLMYEWKLKTEKTSGTFLVKDGTVVTGDIDGQNTGVFIFESNPNVDQVNQVSALAVGNSFNESDRVLLQDIIKRLDADEVKTADGTVIRYEEGTNNVISNPKLFTQDCETGEASLLKK